MSEAKLEEDEEDDLDEFEQEIQNVTNLLNDPKETEETSTKLVDSYEELSAISPSPEPEASVSYSTLSEDAPYVHGATFSSPRVTFHSESAIQTVVEIHDLLIRRDQTLFFIADSEDDSDSDLDADDLSQERKVHDVELDVVQEHNASSKDTKSQKRTKRKKRKLKRTASEQKAMFAIKLGSLYIATL